MSRSVSITGLHGYRGLALAIRALCRVVKDKISDVSDVSAISDIKKEIGTNVFVLTSQVTKHAHDVIEEHEIDIDPEYVTSRRMGRVLGKMRFEKIRENGTGKRGWQFSFDDLHGWTTSYGLLIEQELGIDVTDNQNVTSRIPNVTNGTNVTNVTVNGANGAGASFAPSSEWQEIPDGTPVPPGGEYRMDMNSGKNYGRWPEQTPANGNGLGRVFTDAEIGRVAEPPDEQGRRVVKDSHGLWFDEDGRLWDGDEEPLQGTLRWLRQQLEALV